MPSRASYGARGVGRFLETIAGNMREERLMQRRSEEEASTDRRRANMRMGEQTLAQFLEESSPQYQQNLKHQANEDARLTRQIETDNLNAATAAERERRLGAAADESIEEAKERRARERRERDENKSESLKRAEKEDLWAQYAREYIRVDPVTVLDEGGFHQLANTDTYKGMNNSYGKQANTLREQELGLGEEGGAGIQLGPDGNPVQAGAAPARQKAPTFDEWLDKRKAREEAEEEATPAPTPAPTEEPTSFVSPTGIDPLMTPPITRMIGKDDAGTNPGESMPPGSEAVAALERGGRRRGRGPVEPRKSLGEALEPAGAAIASAMDRGLPAGEAAPDSGLTAVQGMGAGEPVPEPTPRGADLGSADAKEAPDHSAKTLGPKAQAAVDRAIAQGVGRNEAIQMIIDKHGEEALAR